MDSLRQGSSAIKQAFKSGVKDLNIQIRTAVSKDKFRFKDDEFDLDLCYITDRIIAMGFPGDGVSSAYRNNRNEVASFLNKYHPEHYMILNVSEERYDTKLFQDRVTYIGWPDHHAPSLEQLMQCLQCIRSWLDANPLNVIVIHCMAGRGRTGAVIASYFLLTGVCSTAAEALALFASKRSQTGDGVNVASQKRYVEYIERIVHNQVSLTTEAQLVRLKSIILRPVPRFGLNGDCMPCVQIWSISDTPVLLFTNQHMLRSFSPRDPAMVLDLQDTLVRGDVLIRFSNEGLIPLITDRMMMRFSFHTNFLQNYFLDLSKSQLDAPGSGSLTDARFPPEFGIRLIYADGIDNPTLSPIQTQSQPQEKQPVASPPLSEEDFQDL